MLIHEAYGYSPVFQQRVCCKVYSVRKAKQTRFHVVPYSVNCLRLGLPSFHETITEVNRAIDVLFGEVPSC